MMPRMPGSRERSAVGLDHTFVVVTGHPQAVPDAAPERRRRSARTRSCPAGPPPSGTPSRPPCGHSARASRRPAPRAPTRCPVGRSRGAISTARLAYSCAWRRVVQQEPRAGPHGVRAGELDLRLAHLERRLDGVQLGAGPRRRAAGRRSRAGARGPGAGGAGHGRSRRHAGQRDRRLELDERGVGVARGRGPRTPGSSAPRRRPVPSRAGGCARAADGRGTARTWCRRGRCTPT